MTKYKTLTYNFQRREESGGLQLSFFRIFMNSYNVEFQSQSFKLMTEHDSEVFKALKSEVESKLKEVQSSHKEISIEKALFLTCLCLVEDKFLLKKAVDKNISHLESQARSILKDLESSPNGIRLKMIS